MMRRTRPPATSHVASEPRPAPTPHSYDWGRFGRHRLRASAGVLIDSPIPLHGASWLGTLWPDLDDSGWVRMLWESDRVHCSGWRIPGRLAGGDVVEFGSDYNVELVRWYGIIDSYDAVEWLTIQGPYNDPTDAHEDAQRILAHLRYREPLKPVVSRTPCVRPRLPKHR